MPRKKKSHSISKPIVSSPKGVVIGPPPTDFGGGITDGGAPDQSQQTPAVPFAACSPPDTRTPPQFSIYFRRPLVLTPRPIIQLSEPPQFSISAAQVSGGNAVLGLDPTFLQTWNLTNVTIGDLASAMSIAPLEQLTLQFQMSQRKVLSQSSLDSTESIQSSESTTSDKEAVNVTRASTETQNWHVDATASVSCGPASLSVTGGYSKGVTNSNQQAISHISDSTKKSAQSLKTVHKIEISGSTDTTISSAQTRTFKNPYYDRSMSINVFHLLKHYSVQTEIYEVRAAIIISVDDLVFDSAFVLGNADFLRSFLLDSSLLDNISTALQGAMPTISLSPDAETLAATISRQALHLLFEDINIFNVANLAGKNANNVSTSFNAQLASSGLSDSLANHLGTIFVILNFFYAIFKTPSPSGGGLLIDTDDDTAIRAASVLAADVGKKWDTLYPDYSKDPAETDIKHILDNKQFTEIFRRLPGFLTLVNGAVAPLLGAAQQAEDAANEQAQANYLLTRLIVHLTANSNYYVQNYLTYISEQTRNQAIIDFAASVLGSCALPTNNPQVFDTQRAFVDGQQIVIPTFVPLTADDVASYGQILFGDDSAVEEPIPEVVEIDVPCDGIHIEVAPGDCVLPNVPPPPQNSLSIGVQNASVDLNG
jgi:hypothetical protein